MARHPKVLSNAFSGSPPLAYGPFDLRQVPVNRVTDRPDDHLVEVVFREAVQLAHLEDPVEVRHPATIAGKIVQLLREVFAEPKQEKQQKRLEGQFRQLVEMAFQHVGPGRIHYAVFEPHEALEPLHSVIEDIGEIAFFDARTFTMESKLGQRHTDQTVDVFVIQSRIGKVGKCLVASGQDELDRLWFRRLVDKAKHTRKPRDLKLMLGLRAKLVEAVEHDQKTPKARLVEQRDQVEPGPIGQEPRWRLAAHEDGLVAVEERSVFLQRQEHHRKVGIG